MAIVGDSLDKYVKEQISVRQEKLSQYDKDIDLNRYLTSRTAFLRLTSGINVTSGDRITKTLGLANANDYINNGLAKQFVISSAYFNGEFTSDIGYYSNTSYGFYSDSDVGYVPPPGIISATVKTLNKGSLKEATINLICHNLTQFKIMDTLFLKLRYSLLLEWGHTIFYDNNKALQTDNTFNLSDDFLKGVSQSDLLNKIENYRDQSSGNYDAFFGVIKNYEWELMENGSYSITLTAISTGDIIESMKINANTTPDQTSEGNNAQYKKSTLHKLLGDVVNINEANGGWAHGYHQANGEKALNSADLSSFSSIEYSYRKSGDNNTTSGPTSILTNNESTRVFFKDLELDQNNNTVMQQYIKLGTLFRIIEAFTLYYNADRKTTGEPVFKINTNFTTNRCLTIPNQASLDPRICLIPLGFNTADLKDQVKTKYVETTTKYYFDQSGGTYLFGREESTDANVDDILGNRTVGDRYIVQVDSKYPNENNAVNRVGTVISYATVVSIGASTALRQRLGAPPSTHTDDFVTVTTVSYTESAESEAAKNALATGGTLRYLGNEFRIKGSPSVGRTMHIYANVSHVIKTLDNNLDDDGNIALFEFLKNLMSSIQEALGGINDFEVVYRDDENTFYIIDQAYIPSAYHGVEEPRININLLQSDNGSFATRFSLKSELTPAIANAVAMGAQTNGNTLISNSTNFSYLFDGTKDRLLTKKRNVNVDDGSKSFNDSRYSKAYDDYISFITKIVNASNYPLTDADISRHKTSIVDLFNLDVGDYTHKKNIPGTGFIPLNLQLTLDGLSGIKQFQAFKITETLLPDEYINRIKFITKTVTHKIDSRGWFTDISSLSIPKTDKLNDFTNLPNPNITVINTPTDDNSGGGGMGANGDCGGTPRPYTDSNFNILSIPESNNCWRSAQIPEVYLKQFLTDHKIKNVVRLNGHKFQCGDSGYGGAKGTPWDVEERICKELGINFYKLVPTTDSDQSKIEALLNQGDTWVHCMRGADRTGGAVGGWLYHVKGWTTDRVWNYSVHIKGCHWNTQCFDNVWTSGGYSTQAKKFGVATTAQAQDLARRYP